ncbi:MAG: dienelactone hydrolase, partial [Comamonadaceae bacterium]
MSRSTARSLLKAVALAVLAAPARAGTGLAELPGLQGDGPITVFYPSGAPDQSLTRGPFTLQLPAIATD